jgi:SAM-dependent methyltransferase
MIRPGARVLDVGCGDGALLEHLKTKNVDGRGIEISQANVNACVARGLGGGARRRRYRSGGLSRPGVRRGDPVPDHPGDGKPRAVLEHLLRIGGAPRFHCPISAIGKCAPRCSPAGACRAPRALDYSWWATPNIHLCTLADFVDLTRECGATIVEAHALNDNGTRSVMNPKTLTHGFFGPNLFAQGGVFLLKKKLVVGLSAIARLAAGPV